MSLNGLPRTNLNGRTLLVLMLHRELGGKGDAHDVYGLPKLSVGNLIVGIVH